MRLEAIVIANVINVITNGSNNDIFLILNI